MQITLKEVTDNDLKQAMEIRMKVFVEEQNVPVEEEYDEFDQVARHFGIFKDNILIGTARLLIEDNLGKIGRVALLKEERGKGYGYKLMDYIISQAKKMGINEFTLGAQIQAMPFYAKLGFKAEGSEYLDAGIPHRNMRLKVE